MNFIISYIREFIRTTHPGLLLFCVAYTALIIFLNYRFGIEPKWIAAIPNRVHRFAGFYIVYLVAFTVPYLALFVVKGIRTGEWKLFLFLLLIAPAIFALKVSFDGLSQLIQHYKQGNWGRYVTIIANLPSRLLLVVIPLLFIWWIGNYNQPFFGVSTKNFDFKPYLVMLLIMVPLISWASTQHDFLHTYPKLKQVAFIERLTNRPGLYNLLFEIAYGIDFVTIELFFRGFLVLAFVRFVGPDAILPMAVFYCSIHFGKPLAECISSFFGGLLLGIIVYQTKSIVGGLVVHLGIAWMMEFGGYVGNILKNR